MSDTAHEPSRTEIEQFFTDEPMVDRQPLRHHRSACHCPDPAKLINPDLVADAVLVEDDEPVRTISACNALRCLCLAWADGPLIGGYQSCHVCLHTKQSHQPRKTTVKARRA